MSDVDFIAPTDPLLRDPQLDYAVEIPVLGIATHFASNSQHVIATIERAFGRWRCVAGLGADSTRAAHVHVIVHAGTEHSSGRAPVRHIVPDDSRLIIQTPGSFAISDPARGESVAYVTTELAADHDHFRESVLEAVTLALLSGFDRHPVHAAAVARDGRTVLLAGASGAGKSTLAHLAHSIGADVLSEDRVWIQLGDGPEPRVWGWPGYARLVTSNIADKRIIALPADRAACYFADAPVVCLLGRASTPSLTPLEPEEIARALTTDVAPGFDRFPARHEWVTRTLAAPGGWRLALSTEPRDAIPFLQRMLNEPPP